MTDNNDKNIEDFDVELYDENLEVEGLEDGVNPGFTTAASAACAGSASCPVGCAGTLSSISSASG